MESVPYMGRSEIALRLGVDRRKVYAITRRPGFPEPCRIRAGDVWVTDDVEAWIRDNWPGAEPASD